MKANYVLGIFVDLTKAAIDGSRILTVRHVGLVVSAWHLISWPSLPDQIHTMVGYSSSKTRPDVDTLTNLV